MRTVATEPASDRDDIASFVSTSPLIGTSGTATATICADRDGRTVPVLLPFCTTGVASSSQEPYWTPASFAPNVPLNQMTHLTWTVTPGTGGNPPTALGTLSVDLPAAKQNVSSYQELTVNMSPDESVVGSTDLTLVGLRQRGAHLELAGLGAQQVGRHPHAGKHLQRPGAERQAGPPAGARPHRYPGRRRVWACRTSPT